MNQKVQQTVFCKQLSCLVPVGECLNIRKCDSGKLLRNSCHFNRFDLLHRCHHAVVMLVNSNIPDSCRKNWNVSLQPYSMS